MFTIEICYSTGVPMSIFKSFLMLMEEVCKTIVYSVIQMEDATDNESPLFDLPFFSGHHCESSLSFVSVPVDGNA